MKYKIFKRVQAFITPLLLINIFLNTVSAVGSWGVDETGKYSFRNVLVIVKDEFSSSPDIVVDRISSSYPIEKVTITSENDDGVQNSVMLLIGLNATDEKEFNEIFSALSEDEYVEQVLKDYYLTPVESYLGDVDKDEKITTEDARLCLKFAAKVSKVETETEMYLADVDGDGVISVSDAKRVLEISCGMKIK